METKELDWPAIIQAIAAAIITIYMAIIASRQKSQATQIETVIEEQKEVKHLVNSSQTNMQTAQDNLQNAIDDLRSENQMLKQDKIDLKAEVALPPETQKVEIDTTKGPVQVDQAAKPKEGKE